MAHKNPAGKQIEKEVSQSYSSLQSRFSFVTKARANIWVTTAVILFITGVIVGIVYVANGNSLGSGLSFVSSEAASLFCKEPTCNYPGSAKVPESYFIYP